MQDLCGHVVPSARPRTERLSKHGGRPQEIQGISQRPAGLAADKRS